MVTEMKKTTYIRLNNILSEVEGWAREAYPLDAEWFDEYLGGQGEVALAVSGNYGLYALGMQEIKRGLLAGKDGKNSLAKKHFFFGFSRMLYSDMIGVIITKVSGQTIIGNLDSITHLMLGAIATGRIELVEPFHQAVLDGIEGNYGVQDGHNPPLGTTLRYSAFGLTIIGDWLGKPLDLDKHALPRDPAWGQLVAHWRAQDLDEFVPVLLSACDAHVERIALTERENDTGQFEFGSVLLAVHPTEILAVLRLRELLGLQNPAQIDHPLMQTPYAAITSRPGEVTERDELLDRFLDVVRQRDPHALPPGL